MDSLGYVALADEARAPPPAATADGLCYCGCLACQRQGRDSHIHVPMSATPLLDHYEVLQVSPRADQETIERVFRLLAKRYHPDNQASGNAERFTALVDSYRILADPEQRARFDAVYEGARESRWRLFDQESATNELVADGRIRLALLSILYIARRNSAQEPGVGIVEIERLLACPDGVVAFHMWYLRENGWIQRLESGLFAITASGVDRVFELGGPAKAASNLLTEGDGAAGSSTTGA